MNQIVNFVTVLSSGSFLSADAADSVAVLTAHAVPIPIAVPNSNAVHSSPVLRPNQRRIIFMSSGEYDTSPACKFGMIFGLAKNPALSAKGRYQADALRQFIRSKYPIAKKFRDDVLAGKVMIATSNQRCAIDTGMIAFSDVLTKLVPQQQSSATASHRQKVPVAMPIYPPKKTPTPYAMHIGLPISNGSEPVATAVPEEAKPEAVAAKNAVQATATMCAPPFKVHPMPDFQDIGRGLDSSVGDRRAGETPQCQSELKVSGRYSDVSRRFVDHYRPVRSLYPNAFDLKYDSGNVKPSDRANQQRQVQRIKNAMRDLFAQDKETIVVVGHPRQFQKTMQYLVKVGDHNRPAWNEQRNEKETEGFWANHHLADGGVMEFMVEKVHGKEDYFLVPGSWQPWHQALSPFKEAAAAKKSASRSCNLFGPF